MRTDLHTLNQFRLWLQVQLSVVPAPCYCKIEFLELLLELACGRGCSARTESSSQMKLFLQTVHTVTWIIEIHSHFLSSLMLVKKKSVYALSY